MPFFQDKKTIRLILLLFGVFLFLFLSITYISHQRFAPGQGLADSVAREALVQFVVRPNSSSALGVDAHTEHQAVRAAFFRPMKEALILKNLSKERRTVQFTAQVEPAAITRTVQWLSAWPLKVSLAPGEEKSVFLEFQLDQDQFKTEDGVLAVKISY